MARVRDLGGQVQEVLPLLRRSVVGPDADHASREAGQVAHLVVQDPPPPLGHVGETAGGLLHQVGFNRLRQHKGRNTIAVLDVSCSTLWGFVSLLVLIHKQ